jgi:nucleoside-diphosphate-sugar epimerase
MTTLPDQRPIASGGATVRAAPGSVFVVGGAGGVGRRLGAQLVAAGHRVTGTHRAPDQAATIAEAGATAVRLDLIGDPVDAFADRMRGHDAVVFSAGAHGTGLDQTTAIDGRGLEIAVQAADAADITRFVLVSVFTDALRDQPRLEGFEHYMAVKRAADVYLAASNLDWVILRPGTLTDDPGTGRVALGPAISYGTAPRDDVAAVIAEVLWRRSISGVALELTTGSVLVVDAVTAVDPATSR